MKRTVQRSSSATMLVLATALVFVLLVRGFSDEEARLAAKHCAQHTNCSACLGTDFEQPTTPATGSGGCGWCESSQSCHFVNGTKVLDDDGSYMGVESHPWCPHKDWWPTECPQCSMSVSCDACAKQQGCGYCYSTTEESGCLEGNSTGPYHNPNQAYSCAKWVPESNQCLAPCSTWSGSDKTGCPKCLVAGYGNCGWCTGGEGNGNGWCLPVRTECTNTWIWGPGAECPSELP